MSRFHQRLREDLSDPKFAEAFYEMSADIALLQVFEETKKECIRDSKQCEAVKDAETGKM